MRARITDSAALRKILPSQITAYLRSKGAKQVGTFSDRAAIWALGKEEFLVPVAAEFADYAYRVADILAALERVEEHSQLEILDDLHEVGFDVVGIGRFPKDETSEAPGIMRAVDFLAHARDLLMAAACAAARAWLALRQSGHKTQSDSCRASAWPKWKDTALRYVSWHQSRL